MSNRLPSSVRIGELVKSGVPEFDEIVKIYSGSAVLVLDESFSEGKAFLHAVYRDRPMVELVGSKAHATSPNTVPLDVDNIQYLSIQVNALRKTLDSALILHLYLPELLVKHGAESVLKMVDFWKSEIRQNGHIEFFLLPKGTFTDFEKKLMAILDGALELSVERTKTSYDTFFTPIRLSEEQYNLKPVRYRIEDGKISIKSPPHSKTLTVKRILEIAETDADVKMVFAGDGMIELPFTHYLLFKEASGWKLSWLKKVVSDRFESVVASLADLVDSGTMKLISLPIDETTLKDRVNEYKEKLRLSCSSSFCDIVDLFVDSFKCLVNEEVNRENLVIAFRETYSRLYTFTLKALEKISFERLLEKVLTAAFDCDAVVKRKSSSMYILELKNCPVCSSSKVLEYPDYCKKSLVPIISGAANVFFDASAEVVEAECGFPRKGRCVFHVRTVS